MKPASNAPIAASIYRELAEIARSHGYALAAHGSLDRDFDLVCIPWAEKVSEPIEVVLAFCARWNAFTMSSPDGKEPPAVMNWGREVYTLIWKGGWGPHIDLSFTPRVVPNAGTPP
jgi:hypothetical protein